MASTKKGRNWYFGLKAHIGSDLQGRGPSGVVTDAAGHDSQVMADCCHGEEQVRYGDKAYASTAGRQVAEAQGQTGRRLTCADRAFNRTSNRVRARVEHVFGGIKHLWGYRRVRYRGLAKNAAHLFTLFALANWYLVRRDLAGT